MAEIGAVISVPDNGLAYQGIVTAVPGTNQFTIPSLAGLGAGIFSGATNPFFAVVVQKGTGTSGAPQGQQQPITAYNNATGQFTTLPFTVPVAVRDQIQILSADLAANPTILAAIGGGGSSPQQIVDSVYFDAVTGAAGTTGTIGTSTNPVNNLTDLMTIGTARKTKKVILRSDVTIDVTMNGYYFMSDNPFGPALPYGLLPMLTIAANIDGSSFIGVDVKGTNSGTGAVSLINCPVGNVAAFTSPSIYAWNCKIITGIGFTNVAEFHNCTFLYPGTIYFYGAGTGKLILSQCAASITLTLSSAVAGASAYLDVTGGGVTINAACTGGTFNLYGNFIFTNNGGAGVVVNDYRPSNSLGGDTVIYPAGITVAPAATLVLPNSALVIGNITVGAGGTLTINGNCQVTGMFNAAADGVTITINGDCQIAGALSVGNGTSGAMFVRGHLETGGTNIYAGAHLFVKGKLSVFGVANQIMMQTGAILQSDGLFCGGAFLAAADGVDISIVGDCQITGVLSVGNGTSGSVIVYGKLTVIGGVVQAASSILTCNDCFAGVLGIVLGANAIFTSASCICEGAFTANTDGVTVTINGDCSIAGAFSLGGGASGTMTVAGNLETGNGGIIAAGATVTCLTLTSTLVAGAGTLNVLIPPSGGSQATVLYPTGITIAPGDTLVIDNSALVIGDVIVGAGATLTINGNCQVTGQFNAAADGVNVTINGDCLLAGPLSLGGGVSGAIIIYGNFQSPQVTIAAGAQFSAAGTVNVAGTFDSQAAGTSVTIGNNCHVGSNLLDGGTMLISGDTICGGTITNAGGTITINGNCRVATHVTNSAAGILNIYGKLDISGNTTTFPPDGYLDNTGGISIFIGNDCHISGVLTNTTGIINIEGSLRVAGAPPAVFNNTTGTITIKHDCYVGGNLSLTGAGSLVIAGDCQVSGAFNAAADGVTITINGDCQIALALFLGAGVSGVMNVYGKLADTRGITQAANSILTCNDCFAGVTGIVLGANAIFTSASCTCEGAFTANADGVNILINGDCQIAGALNVGAGVSGTMIVTGNLQTGAGGTIAAGATVTCLTLTSTLTAGAGTLTVLLPATGGGGPTDWDAIYFDFIHGGTLVGGNDGSPSKPLNNETDVLTQLGVKIFHKIAMNPGVFTWPSNLDDIQFIGIDSSACLVDTGPWSSSTCLFENVSLALIGGAITIPGNLQCPGIIVLDGGSLLVEGDCDISGPVTVGGGASGSMIVYGKLAATGGINQAAGSTLACAGCFAGVTGIVIGTGATFTSASCTCEGAFTANTDGVNITINGNCRVAGPFTLGGGTSGFAMIAGTLSAKAGNSITLSDGTYLSCGVVICDNNLSNTTGNIYIYGDCKVANNLSNTTGTITIYGNIMSSTITQTDTGIIYIYGNAEMSGPISNTTGAVIILGDCATSAVSFTDAGTFVCNSLTCSGAFNAAADGVTITIKGDCQIAGAMFIGGGSSGSMAVAGNLETGAGGTIAAGATVTCLTLTSTLTAGAGTLTVLLPATGGGGPTDWDAVYYDPNNGNTLASGNDGTPLKPLNNEADVLTQIAAKKLSKVKIVDSEGTGFPTFTLPADVTGISFWGDGDNATLHCNSKNADGCDFHFLALWNGANGTAGYSVAYDCFVNFTDNNGWEYNHCTIAGAFTFRDGPLFHDCDFEDAVLTFTDYGGATIALCGHGEVLISGNQITISGSIQYGVPTAGTLTGTQTAANDPLIMTDAAAAFIPNSLVGLTILNTTDGSHGTITANDATSITCAGGLSGGSLNIWTTGDAYSVTVPVVIVDYTIQSNQVKTASTTTDLNQAAADYDLLTGTTGPVEIESLIITMPNAVAGGALTAISIQTDDATPQILIDPTTGAVANLTAEAQLAWQGRVRLGVGKKIQLTIAGGATGAGYVCDVDVEYRSISNGGGSLV